MSPFIINIFHLKEEKESILTKHASLCNFAGPLELTDINKKPTSRESYHKLETNMNDDFQDNLPTQQMSEDNEFGGNTNPITNPLSSNNI